MKRSPWIVALSCLLCAAQLSSPVRAQTDEYQLWAALSTTADLLTPTSPGPTLWLDAHSRRGATGSTEIVRPALGLRVAPYLSAFAGYAWIGTFYDDARDSTHEQRIWEQLTLSHKTPARVSLQSRTRFEQRFSSAGDDVGLRLRQLARVAWEPSASLPLGILFWDEVFIGTSKTDWGATGGFDQNRAFVGLMHQMPPWSRLELGYLMVYQRKVQAEDALVHALSINLVVHRSVPSN